MHCYYYYYFFSLLYRW